MKVFYTRMIILYFLAEKKLIIHYTIDIRFPYTSCLPT